MIFTNDTEHEISLHNVAGDKIRLAPGDRYQWVTESYKPTALEMPYIGKVPVVVGPAGLVRIEQTHEIQH